VVETVLEIRPQPRLVQGGLDRLVEPGPGLRRAFRVEPEAEDNVFVERDNGVASRRVRARD
jgi:hypothetical protein